MYFHLPTRDVHVVVLQSRGRDIYLWPPRGTVRSIVPTFLTHAKDRAANMCYPRLVLHAADFSVVKVKSVSKLRVFKWCIWLQPSVQITSTYQIQYIKMHGSWVRQAHKDMGYRQWVIIFPFRVSRRENIPAGWFSRGGGEVVLV